MFDICLLPDCDRGADGERLGRITIGEFVECFACHASRVTVTEMPDAWRAQLKLLVQGAPAVALVTDPRFAWIVYREGERCFIQEKLALDGSFEPIPPRETVSVDGDRISEWRVGLDAIEDYLRRST